MRAKDLVPQLGNSVAATFDGRAVALLIAYLLVVFTGVVSHEPWFDEAQSWLLARDASMGELLGHYLRYEGHPPLWYALLALPAKLGWPYLSANVLAAVSTTLGVLLFLRLPAVPWPVKVLVPFGFFIAYQYSVIARSYALVLPLLMALAHLYPVRRERILGFTALLIALSNVSVHGLAMAWAFAALYGFELWLEVRSGSGLTGPEKRRHLAALGLFLLATIFLVIVLWPPDDLMIAGLISLKSSVLLLGRMWNQAILGMFSDSAALSVAILAVSLAWFWRQRLLLTYLALSLAVLAITSIYNNRWHEGLFFLVWLFVLVLSWRRPAAPRWRLGMLMVAVVVLVQHTVWAAQSLRYDLTEPYSASRGAAELIRANGYDQGKLFAVGFTSLALQPYFARPLFDNYLPEGDFTFWDWSTAAPLLPVTSTRAERRLWLGEQLAQKPDFVLVGIKFDLDTFYLELLNQDPSYRLVRTFEGGLYWKDRKVEVDHYALYGRIR